MHRSVTRDLLLTCPGTLLVHLDFKLLSTVARCAGTEHIRPMLADRADLAHRYNLRIPFYRKAPVSLPVDALLPDEVVEAILQAARLG
jgi:shikimate kinase